jgi:hypothetical protein
MQQDLETSAAARLEHRSRMVTRWLALLSTNTHVPIPHPLEATKQRIRVALLRAAGLPAPRPGHERNN